MYNFASNDRRGHNYGGVRGGATGSYTVTASSDPRKATDDVQYFNIEVYNPYPDKSIPMELPPTTRTQPIVNRASDYYCSVVRFQIPRVGIPWFDFPNSNPFYDNKQFRITFSDGTTDTTEQLQYVSSGIPSPLGNQPVYFIPQFLKSINDGFIAANAQAIIDGVAGVTANPPYVRMRDDGKLEFWVDQASTVEIWFNWNLFRYINGTFSFYEGYGNANNKDERLFYLPADTGIMLGTNTIDGSTFVPPLATDYYSIVQDYPAFYFWDAVNGIILTTSTLPILSEYSQGIDASGNNVTLNSLTDFIPLNESGKANNSPLLYFANEYRLVDMKGQDPITKIDIKIFSRDNFGVIRPMFLAPFESFSVKLMFVKKSLYDNEYGGNVQAGLPILGL